MYAVYVFFIRYSIVDGICPSFKSMYRVIVLSLIYGLYQTQYGLSQINKIKVVAWNLSKIRRKSVRLLICLFFFCLSQIDSFHAILLNYVGFGIVSFLGTFSLWLKFNTFNSCFNLTFLIIIHREQVSTNAQTHFMYTVTYAVLENHLNKCICVLFSQSEQLQFFLNFWFCFKGHKNWATLCWCLCSIWLSIDNERSIWFLCSFFRY